MDETRVIIKQGSANTVACAYHTTAALCVCVCNVHAHWHSLRPLPTAVTVCARLQITIAYGFCSGVWAPASQNMCFTCCRLYLMRTERVGSERWNVTISGERGKPARAIKKYALLAADRARNTLHHPRQFAFNV